MGQTQGSGAAFQFYSWDKEFWGLRYTANFFQCKKCSLDFTVFENDFNINPHAIFGLGDLWFVDYEKDMVTFALSGVFPFV